MNDMRDYATAVFAEARRKIVEDCKVMCADHSVHGLLQSGSTLRKAVSIFRENSDSALREVLARVSDKVEHRGREWTAAIADVREALEVYAAGAPALLEVPFGFAAAPGDAAYREMKKLIGDCITNLKVKIDNYERGWTAPKPRPWIKRHPAIWAIFLTLISAIVGWAVTKIFS